MCLYPKLVKNRKYTENKKNGGDIPRITDERVLYVPIGCGNCVECRKQKAREWQVRLQEDIKTNNNGIFVTLTFSDESIKELSEMKETKDWPSLKGLTGYEFDNELATRAVRLFLERWRKEHKISLRHWFITELGHNGTENIHIHGIVWCDKNKIEDVSRIWKYGYIWPSKDLVKYNYVNEATVNYITKYVIKTDEKHTQYKSKILTSKGIGRNYTKTANSSSNKFNREEPEKTNETYRTRTGHKIRLPIYWRNAIYSEEEREKLWLKTLDKEERYVLGQKVSVKNGQEEYMKMLGEAQKLNRELGYGDNKKDWDKHQYESELRNIKRKERCAKAVWKNKNENKKN